MIGIFVSLLGPVRSDHAQLVSRKPAPLDKLSVLLRFEQDVTRTAQPGLAGDDGGRRTAAAIALARG